MWKWKGIVVCRLSIFVIIINDNNNIKLYENIIIADMYPVACSYRHPGALSMIPVIYLCLWADNTQL